MIRWKRKALKDLKHLPQDERGYGDIKPLHGSLANFYRLRVGNYRVILSFEGEDMIIHRVLSREDAY